MAESEADGGWWGSWVNQTLQNARAKSAETLEFIKRDLSEFTEVVQHDTTSTIAATATAVREKLSVDGSSHTGQRVKEGLSSIFGTISEAFAPSLGSTLDQEENIVLMANTQGSTEPYDRAKARFYSLQADPATYCNEPDGPPETYMTWAAAFSLKEKKREVSDLLAMCPAIRAMYTRLVPAAVSHTEFWHRYFYRLHQLEQGEARRAELVKRAHPRSDETVLSWEDEEDEFPKAPTSNLWPDQECIIPGMEHSSKNPEAYEGRTEHLSDAADGRSIRTAVDHLHSSPESQSQAIVLLDSEIVHNPCDDADDYDDEPCDGVTISSTEDTLSTLTLAASDSVVALTAADGTSNTELRRVAANREESADLRVYDLRSDSDKSTPTSAKIGSSTDISEDWEKDFDLDMTEEEIQQALSKADVPGELEGDWEDWE
uniref:BSD domain-containing protein 1-like n=1 Tax=Myxine glutinosa TaxID=7769 RepID=UPI00358DEBA9